MTLVQPHMPTSTLRVHYFVRGAISITLAILNAVFSAPGVWRRLLSRYRVIRTVFAPIVLRVVRINNCYYDYYMWDCTEEEQHRTYLYRNIYMVEHGHGHLTGLPAFHGHTGYSPNRGGPHPRSIHDLSNMELLYSHGALDKPGQGWPCLR